MPIENDNIIFGSEFDPSGLVDGVNHIIDNYKKLKTEQDAVNASMSKGEQQIKSTASATQLIIDKYEKAKNQLVQLNQAAGKPISLAITNTDVLKRIQEVHDAMETAFKSFTATGNLKGFDELKAKLIGSKKEFTEIGTVVDAAKAKIEEMYRTAIASAEKGLGKPIKELEPHLASQVNAQVKVQVEGTEEFKALNEIVKVGTPLLQNYETVLEDVGGSSISLRSRLNTLRIELTKLEDAGLENTETYKNMQLESARLTDQYGDMQATIRVLASDTKELDFGVSAVQVAASAYQVLAGAMTLFGVESEDAQIIQARLLGIMNLVQGAQQLQNLLLKEGTFLVLGQQYASRGLAAINLFLASSFGAVATAASAVRGALLLSGIGALAIGIGYLISKLIEEKEVTEDAELAQKSYTDSINAAAGDIAKAVENVEELRHNIQLAKDGVVDKERVVKQYNDTIGKTTGFVKDLDEAERELGENADAYIRFTLLKAAANFALGEAAKEAAARQLEIIQETSAKDFIIRPVGEDISKKIQEAKDASKEYQQINQQAIKELAEFGKITDDTRDKWDNISKVIEQGILFPVTKQQSNMEKVASDFRNQAEELAKNFGFDLLGGIVDPKDKKDLENVFEERLRELTSQLTNLTRGDLVTFDTIRAKVKEELDKLVEGINKDLADKKLTLEQSQKLKVIIGLIGEAELKKEFSDYNRVRKEAQEAIDKELSALQIEAHEKRIERITNEFERETQTILLEREKTIITLQQEKSDALEKLSNDFNKGIFGNPDSPVAKAIFEANKRRYIDRYNELFKELELTTQRKQQDAAARAFQVILEGQKEFSQQVTARAEIEANERKTALTNELNKELEINKNNEEKKKELRETFAREISKIDTTATLIQLRNREVELEVEKTLLQIRIANAKISESEKAKLIKQLQDVERELAKIKLNISTASTPPKDDPVNAPQWLDDLKKVADGYGQLASSIVGAYDTISSAQQAMLDREISFQQVRVDRAREMAEKGNADILELEEQRLDELNHKREEAARQQLVIDNALRLSQASLAAVTAIAQAAAAPPPLNLALIATAAATVFAAIGAAYAFVSSLQAPSQSFRYGELDVKPSQTRGHSRPATHPDDTVAAWLTPHEAVIPVEQNRKYKDVIEAIYYEKIPADDLNSFVRNYNQDKRTYNKEYEIRNFNNQKYIIENKTDTNLYESKSSASYDYSDHKKHFSSNTSNIFSTVFNEYLNKDGVPISETNFDRLSKYQNSIEAIYYQAVPADIINGFTRSYAERPISLQNIYNNDKRKFNHADLSAVYDKTSKQYTSVFNDFIHRYDTRLDLPELNLQKLSDATANVNVNMNSRETEKKLDKINENLVLLSEHLLKLRPTNINIDKDGFMLSVMELANQINLLNRS